MKKLNSKQKQINDKKPRKCEECKTLWDYWWEKGIEEINKYNKKRGMK